MDFSKKSYARADLEKNGAIFIFRGAAAFLSNFHLSPVEMYGIIFPTVEHAFSAAKLDPNGGVFSREEVMEEMRVISLASSPAAAKGLGRRRMWKGKPFMRADWDSVKKSLILELLRRKFAIPHLRAQLLATGQALLVEGNTHGDKLWGMVESAGVFYGSNWLGEMLMVVRAEIRAQMEKALPAPALEEVVEKSAEKSPVIRTRGPRIVARAGLKKFL